MKKNMKGFTLIELLAVIVILAVIALIATPIIMNVINEAKEGSKKDAAFGYAKAVETAIATQMVKCPNMVVTVGSGNAMTITNDSFAITGCGSVTTLKVNYKGTKPDTIALTYANGAVAGKVNGYDVTSGNK